MILNLLFPLLLLLGAVESQRANMTEEELTKAEVNQTLSKFASENSTITPVNRTSSSYKDKRSQIEDELQNNKTSTVITEDDENFQDQETEYPARHCNQVMLVTYSDICGTVFHKEMMSIDTEKWCVLENIIRPYNDLTICLEQVSEFVGCYYPQPDTQDFFIQIHSHYFHNCSMEELLLEDAPHGLVIVLTLVPVSIIPVLVYLVVWKSNVHK